MTTATAPRVLDLAAAFEAHEATLLRYLGRLLGNGFDAEDVLQDTLIRAMTAALTPPVEELRPWLFRIATNRAIDLIRVRRHTTPFAVDPPHPADTASSAEDRAMIRAVRAFVETLPPKQRAALILRRYEGREYAEIGRVLGCSEESARANAYQALRRLRAHFQEYDR